MSINLTTLKCNECGSAVLERSGLNQYTCKHCGSVAVVEDKVSERLDRVLEQVKNAAAERLAAEQAAKQKQVQRIALYAIGGGVALVVVTALVGALFPKKSSTTPTRTVASVDRNIPTDGLRLAEPRQVLVGTSGNQRIKLLVTAHNETGKVLERPTIAAEFYDGDTKIGSDRETLPLHVMAPGESASVLLDLPSDKTVTRQTLAVQRLSAPYRLGEGPVLNFERVRLVQSENTVRLVGRIANTRPEAIAGTQVLVTLYDDSGAVIGYGYGYTQASELRPGERSTVDIRLERFGGNAAIAAWDYRVDYNLLGADGSRNPVAAKDRVVRTSGGPETLNAELRMSTDDLLATEAELFDPKQIAFEPLVPGRSNIQRPLYFTELVNRSQDTIALAPGAVIAHYDGNQAGERTVVHGLAYLYPGERFPVLLEPRRAGRITQTRVDWKPMRRAALPGPRVPLEVEVTGTRAQTGSVLLNFSQRFSYKYVEVQGRVKNPGTAIVRKARLWVSLRDRDDRLSGFKLVDNLPAIAPGDSAPFQVSVEQNGKDFAKVETFYQTE